MRILDYAEFLFEGEYQNFSELKKELVSYLKGKNYKNYIDTLNDMLKDPKTRTLIDGGFGGDLGDVQLKFSEKIIPVNKLNPTQNEIGLAQSLDYGLESTKNFDIYFMPYAQIKYPIVTFNSKYVIDGHHRWSQLYCFNPETKAVCLDFSGNISPMDMLKVTQGAIAATKGEIPSLTKHGENIYDLSASDIRRHIEEKLCDDVVLAFKTKDGKNFQDREDVVNYITNNAVSMIKNHPILKTAPNRGLMPQTSDDNDKMSEPLKRLRDGKVVVVK